jgi:hypothetical protein
MSRVLRILIIAGLAIAATLLLSGAAGAQPVKVGDETLLTSSSPLFEGPGTSGLSELAWREEVSMAGASYIAVHFSSFKLPEGAVLTVRTPDSSRSRSYTRFGKGEGRPLRDGFWAMHMPGDVAIIELVSNAPVREGAVVIDRFAHGYPDVRIKDREGTKAICGTDDSRWAKCYQTSGPDIYNEARALARLLINGSSACTGWLVGSEGHLMTNEHCIGSSSAALNTDYEFMAEGSTCTTNCASWFACGGTVVADSATLIQLDSAYDYALVRLPTNPTGTYGYMQLRETGPVLNERIYNPAHPAAWGKRIGVESTHSSDQSGYCEVYDLCRPVCAGGHCDTGYYCDTQGGSSGSPILAYSDHCVVSLHHCANCPNRGVPIEDVINDLGGNLPANALCGGTPNTPPTVNISAPADGSSYEEGTSVSFSGTASDTEDGNLTSSLSWSSSRDGTIGSGGSFSTSTLSAGTHTITASVTDSGGLSGSDSITISITSGPSECPAGSIDFTSLTLTSYSNQNVTNDVTVEDGGDTLHLVGNTWVRSTSTFSVTANTVIDFEFASGSQGEIHAIGFDNNDTLNDDPRHFMFWGTQSWTGTGKIDWTPKYSGGGSYQSYSIPVGEYYTGTMYLVFTNDKDSGTLDNESLFKCVRVYETAPPDCDVEESFEGGTGGWTNGADSTCTTGDWIRGTPNYVENGGVVTQVSGAQAGTYAYYTQYNSSDGVDDVDGGVCTAESPVYNVTASSTVTVWYYHGQRDAGDDPSGDYFRLLISVNGGAWQTMASFGDVTRNAAWTMATHQVSAGATVELRVEASDGAGPGDLVEGGIDSISICAN